MTKVIYMTSNLYMTSTLYMTSNLHGLMCSNLWVIGSVGYFHLYQLRMSNSICSKKTV